MTTNTVDYKTQQTKMWGGAARDWEKYDNWFETQCSDLTQWLVTESGIKPGMEVLDLASGVGQPGFTASQIVGTTGRIVSTDIAPEMVEAASRLSQAKGLTNVEHRIADLEHIPFPDNSFDAITCRFGLMFCPDPARAASEIFRVLKPGGRFALSVWDAPAHNEQFSTFLSVLNQVAPPAMAPDPKAPGLFRLAAPGELESTLKAGGFTDFKVEQFPSQWHFTSPENYWEVMTELAAPLKVAAATQPAETLAQIKSTVIENLRGLYGSGALAVKATPKVASGTK